MRLTDSLYGEDRTALKKEPTMASSANPGLLSDLSDLSGTDACAALLKVNAEMFAAAPARDRETIETFEALALGFLPKADRATLNDIAHILGPCRDTPPSVLDYLQRHVPEARGIMPAHRTRSGSGPDARYLATPAGRAHLASRPQLTPATIERILALREETSEDLLAANPALRATMPAFHRLVRRAVERPALARILLQRADLSITHATSLYLAADRDQRSLIRMRLRDEAAPAAASAFRPGGQDAAALVGAAGDGDIERFERLLTDAFGFPGSTEWRILQIGRHLLVGLALKALGVPERQAIRILLTLHPALSYPLSALRELLHEMRDVPGPTALCLVEAILGLKALGAEGRALHVSGARSRK